ncbi:MAG: PepSY domain-containing protein [Terriglobales bacterium]
MKSTRNTILSLAALAVLAALPALAQKPGHHPVTMAAARKLALAKEPGTIKSGEKENEKGRVIYSFDIQTATDLHEVNVDAHTGEIVEDSVENPAAEAKEAAQDAAAAHHKHHKKG